MWFRHHEKKVVNEWYNQYYLKAHGKNHPSYDPNKTNWISSKWHWLAKENENGHVSTCGYAFKVVQEKEALGRRDHKCSNCYAYVRNTGADNV